MAKKSKAERLKEQQIAARNPGSSKIPGYDWQKHAAIAGERKREQEERSIMENLWELLPPRWKGALIGILIGLIPFLITQIFMSGTAKLLGMVFLLVCFIIGFVFGSLMKTEQV